MATLGLQRDPNHTQTIGLTSRGYPSLFQPDSDDEYSTDSDSDRELQQPQLSLLPVEELILEAPQTLASLLDVLLPRLQPRAEVKGVSLQDQKNFMTVLVGELASQFPVIQHQIDDPFLNPQQNKTLHRKVVVRVCQITEDLYNQYLLKAANIGADGVFSLAVNLSRLRAELTLETNKRLNIPLIRRQVLSQIRGALPSINGNSPRGQVTSPRYRYRQTRLPPIPKQEVKKRTARRLSLDDLKLAEPLKTKMTRFGVRLESGAIRKRIKKLRSRLPSSPDQYESNDNDDDYQWDGYGEELDNDYHQSARDRSVLAKSNTAPKLSRVPSMPELWGGFLLCDLGLTSRKNRPADKEGEHQILGIHRPPSVGRFLDLKLDERDTSSGVEIKQMGEYTDHELSKDLHDLQASSTNAVTSAADDLHPLLQAHGHGLSEKQVRRLAQYDAEIRRADEEKAKVQIIDQDTDEGSLVENSIPSVPTLDQLPYLAIEHVQGPSSSHPSMHVKSGMSLRNGRNRAPSSGVLTPSGRSQVLSDTDLAESFPGSSLGRSEHSRINVGDTGSLLVDHQQDYFSTPESRVHGQQMHATAQEFEEDGNGTNFPSDFNITESRLTQEEIAKKEDERNLHFKQQSLVDTSMFDASVGGMDSVCDSSGAFPSGFSISSDFQVQPEEVIETHQSPPPTPPSPTSHQAQPAVVTTRFQEQGVVRTSDIRVSERTPLNELRLTLFGPVYNQLTGELDSSMIEELDSTLHEGKEITGVYEEITKTLSTSHLDVLREPTLEPTIHVPIEFSGILASDTLHHRRSRRVANKALYRSIPHPWGEGTSRKEWERSNQYQGPDLDQYGIKPESGRLLSPHLAHISRAYTTWSNWWRSTVNSEDYLKYASKEESDYLRLVYHLYDSDGSDSEAEEEYRVKKERLELLQKKLKAKEARRQHRYSAKSRYESGAWNVNTVMMGGLGGDPECSSSDEEDTDPALIEQVESPEVVQTKLREIWNRLYFPESQQMDMTIKYSNPRIMSQLGKVLSLWDQVCDMVEKREVLLSQLEEFEREASDPSRFFSKGTRGSSATRLNEARKRDSMHKDLDTLDKQVSRVLRKLLVEHGDTVTYRGRPYSDKMSSDRTEMLYWLQQERRQAILKPAITTLTMETDVPLKPTVTVPGVSPESTTKRSRTALLLNTL